MQRGFHIAHIRYTWRAILGWTALLLGPFVLLALGLQIYRLGMTTGSMGHASSSQRPAFRFTNDQTPQSPREPPPGFGLPAPLSLIPRAATNTYVLDWETGFKPGGPWRREDTNWLGPLNVKP